MAASRWLLALLPLTACVDNPPADGGDDIGSSDSGSSDSGSSDSGSSDSGSSDSGSSDSDTDTGPIETWRSALYPEDWTPDFSDGEGHFLHDFSYAGYHNGEAEPPEQVPGIERSVLLDGADPSGQSDSTAAIQATIDAVAQAGGGVVALPAGSFRCDGLLEVVTSGVVIRGAGVDQTFLWFTRDTDMSDLDHLRFRGTVSAGAELPLSEDGVARSSSVRVATVDPNDLAVGDDVGIGWVITDAFVEDHHMTGTWMVFNGQWRPFFRRTVTAIDCDGMGCTLTLDVPLRYPALLRDQASVRVETGYLEEVGVEQLAVSTVSADWDQAWSNARTHAIAMIGVKDGWMRALASFESDNSSDDRQRQLMSGGLLIRDSKRVTVADATMARPQHRGESGNGYLFEISRSSEILTRDCQGYDGRHNFIQNWDFGTSGCVWLRVHSEGGTLHNDSTETSSYPGYSDFHHSLAMANLIDDSVIEDGWHAVNRTSFSSGAGMSATQNVFWNLRGAGTIRSFQWAWGYVIGTSGLKIERLLPEGVLFESLFTEPEDWAEGIDEPATLEPASLYEDQLARRLGGWARRRIELVAAVGRAMMSSS